MGADAFPAGSVLTLGKDETVFNVAVTLRLVECETGRVLWTSTQSGRRVWRREKLRDVTQGVAATPASDLAQFGAGAAETNREAMDD